MEEWRGSTAKETPAQATAVYSYKQQEYVRKARKFALRKRQAGGESERCHFIFGDLRHSFYSPHSCQRYLRGHSVPIAMTTVIRVLTSNRLLLGWRARQDAVPGWSLLRRRKSSFPRSRRSPFLPSSSANPAECRRSLSVLFSVSRRFFCSRKEGLRISWFLWVLVYHGSHNRSRSYLWVQVMRREVLASTAFQVERSEALRMSVVVWPCQHVRLLLRVSWDRFHTHISGSPRWFLLACSPANLSGSSFLF